MGVVRCLIESTGSNKSAPQPVRISNQETVSGVVFSVILQSFLATVALTAMSSPSTTPATLVRPRNSFMSHSSRKIEPTSSNKYLNVFFGFYYSNLQFQTEVLPVAGVISAALAVALLAACAFMLTRKRHSVTLNRLPIATISHRDYFTRPRQPVLLPGEIPCEERGGEGRVAPC